MKPRYSWVALGIALVLSAHASQRVVTLPESVCAQVPKSRWVAQNSECHFEMADDPAAQAKPPPMPPESRKAQSSASLRNIPQDISNTIDQGYALIQSLQGRAKQIKSSGAKSAKVVDPDDVWLPAVLADFGVRMRSFVQKINAYGAQINAIRMLAHADVNVLQMAVAAKSYAQAMIDIGKEKEKAEENISDERGGGRSVFACMKKKREEILTDQMVFQMTAAAWLRNEINTRLDDPQGRWMDDLNALLGGGGGKSVAPNRLAITSAQHPKLPDLSLQGAAARVFLNARFKADESSPYTTAEAKQKEIRHRLLTEIMVGVLTDEMVSRISTPKGETRQESLDYITAKGILFKAAQKGETKKVAGISREISDRLSDSLSVGALDEKQGNQENDLLTVWASGEL